MARDRGYWRRVIFPTAFGLTSESLGITSLHCACVARGGSGLLLAGEAGAGKSTLSVALAQSGFAFLSDDWTYFSQRDQHMLAWGLATPVKLLPEAAEYFGELRNLEPSISLNGERAYEVDPEDVLGIQRSLCCKPRWLIFLEREEEPGHEFVRISAREAAARLEFDLEDLPPELWGVRDSQQQVIAALVRRECWRFRYGENPQAAAQTLAQFCADSESAPPVVPGGFAPNYGHATRTGPDVIRRFTPTPLTSDLPVRGRIIRLETNRPALLQQARKALEPNGSAGPGQHEFLWRIVVEDQPASCATFPRISGFSADGLHLLNIGQYSFLAVDREARTAVGFVVEELVKDAHGFEQVFLTPLVTLTADSLGGGNV